MLTVSHIVAGAALGSLVPDSQVALPVAFGLGWVSHYVLDMVPHWERLSTIRIGESTHPPHDSRFSTETPISQWPRAMVIQAFLDVILALALLLWITHSTTSGQPFWLSKIFWGGIGGIFPDVVDNTPFWNRFLHRLPFFKQAVWLHRNIHVTGETQQAAGKYTGLITQLAVIGLGLWRLLK